MNQQYKVIINTQIDRDATSRSLTDCQIYLSRPIEGNQYDIEIGVRKVSIPNTAYPFHPTENRLYYRYHLDGPDEVFYIELDPYRTYDEVSDVVAGMNAGFTANNHDLTASVDANTSKIHITNDSIYKVRLLGSYIYEGSSQSGVVLGNQANTKLGFTQDLTNEVMMPDDVVSGASLPRLIYTQCYHLVSNLGDASITETPSPFENPRVLCTVLNTANWGEIINKEFINDDMLTFNYSRDISSFQLTLLDDQFRTVDLNGSPIVVELEYRLLPRR